MFSISVPITDASTELLYSYGLLDVEDYNHWINSNTPPNFVYYEEFRSLFITSWNVCEYHLDLDQFQVLLLTPKDKRKEVLEHL